MEKHIILGIHVTKRVQKAQEIQQNLSQYGANIRTRLGMHEVEHGNSPVGVIIIEWHGEEAQCDELVAKLDALDGVETQKMVFTHEED